MNLVRYYIRNQYVPIIESFCEERGRRGANLTEFRNRLVNEYGCQSVSRIRDNKPGAPSIWTLRVNGFLLIYKYDPKQCKITHMEAK